MNKGKGHAKIVDTEWGLVLINLLFRDGEPMVEISMHFGHARPSYLFEIEGGKDPFEVIQAITKDIIEDSRRFV